MFQKLSVGTRYMGEVRADGGVLLHDASGFLMINFFDTPTLDEVYNFKSGTIKISLSEIEGLAILVWHYGKTYFETPFNAKLGNYHLEPVPDGLGYACTTVLVDTKTRIIKGVRLLSFPTEFSRELKDIIDRQSESDLPSNSIGNQGLLAKIFDDYTTEKIEEEAISHAKFTRN